MKKYLIASLMLAAVATPAWAAEHYVVQDSGYCAVLDATPSRVPGLRTIGNKKGYDSREAAEQALKGQPHCTT